MKELQAKLDQTRRDKKLAISTFDKEIQALKTEMADSEVTYSIGDRFTRGEVKCILVTSECNKVCMVNLRSGNRFNDPRKVYDCDKITKSEFIDICKTRVTRYWDARKQCKC